ncbi:unnamed protein product [Polarella glacialis]|uniref:Uncharacterized protein n=1 Tax=Polarella glacialis TaxID=89957 RepID=A0A813EMF3_POLGL|nr:unnamed protein product [Polarella glacialis]
MIFPKKKRLYCAQACSLLMSERKNKNSQDLRLVPISFLSYEFSLLLFVACFNIVFVVDNECQKRNLIGTDRRGDITATPARADSGHQETTTNNTKNKIKNKKEQDQE